MNTPIVQADALCKRYGVHSAVDHVSFSVARGEVFGLLGPNGAGKTTTILMMLGLTEATSGTIRVLGHDPQRAPLRVKRHVGYMPDSVGFYDHLTAWENLAYTARLAGIPSTERAQRMTSALERVKLAHVAHSKVGAFSRGMRQRLGLAEIVLKRADIAVLDEPTSGLDPQAAEDFLALIGQLKQDGVTVLLSSHMLDHMQRICDRVALFRNGRIALSGTVEELAQQVLGGHRYVSVEARGGSLRADLEQIDGVQAVEQEGEHSYRLLTRCDVRGDVARAVVAAGATLLRMDDDAPSLNVIYNHYFQSLDATEERHAA